MLLFLPDCRDVLRGLRKIAKSTNDSLTFVSDAPYICRFNDLSVRYDYSRYANEIGAIIGQLEDDGYIRAIYGSYQFVLTHKGLHSWRHLLRQICISVVIPMIVSFATTCATLLANGLLQWP